MLHTTHPHTNYSSLSNFNSKYMFNVLRCDLVSGLHAQRASMCPGEVEHLRLLSDSMQLMSSIQGCPRTTDLMHFMLLT